jgi:hypothetical protein
MEEIEREREEASAVLAAGVDSTGVGIDSTGVGICCADGRNSIDRGQPLYGCPSCRAAATV